MVIFRFEEHKKALSWKDVREGIEAEIIGDIIELRAGRHEYRIRLKADGNEYEWLPSNLDLQDLADLFGANTEAWKGRRIRLKVSLREGRIVLRAVLAEGVCFCCGKREFTWFTLVRLCKPCREEIRKGVLLKRK